VATEDSVSVDGSCFCSLTDAITPGGPEGLRSLTNPKAVVVDRWPWLFETKIPWLLDYPIRSPLRAWCVLTFLCTLKQLIFEGTL
jgi:hypothetical protein